MPLTGDKLSILGFGCMRLPMKGIAIDKPRAIAQIRGAIDRGVNYLDTAWPYHAGASETLLGEALEDGYRERVKIADKLSPWLCKSQEDMETLLDAQLKKLKTDQIDYYLIHALDGKGWERIKSFGVVDFLKRAQDDGRIKNIGFSFHGIYDDFQLIVDDNEWSFCQIQYNILDENSQAGRKGLNYAAAAGLGVIIMEPLRGGGLTEKLPGQVADVYDRSPTKRSNAEWALRWLWDHPEIQVVLSGMNEESHIDENIKIASEAEPCSLTEDERAILDEASEVYRKVCKVPCTGCQYCMPCPFDVNIPRVFDFYNQYYFGGSKFITNATYVNHLGGILTPDPHLASQCTGCKKCVKKCPQLIDIPAEMKNAKKVLERPIRTFFIKWLMRLFMFRK